MNNQIAWLCDGELYLLDELDGEELGAIPLYTHPVKELTDRIAELEKLTKDIWVGTELLNEGYDATVTTKIELFFSEEAAQQWVHEIKANPDYRPNYFWRQCEKQQIK